MSAHLYANFQSVALTGTQNHHTGIETGIVTATTIHQIVCLATGSIIITPMAGPAFTWSPTVVNQTIDVVVKATTVSSGTFIGFKAKFVPAQGRGTSAGWQY